MTTPDALDLPDSVFDVALATYLDVCVLQMRGHEDGIRAALTAALPDVITAVARGANLKGYSEGYGDGLEKVDAERTDVEGSWVCGRCGEAPEMHANPESRCVYDPVFLRSDVETVTAAKAEERERIIALLMSSAGPALDDAAHWATVSRRHAARIVSTDNDDPNGIAYRKDS